MDITSSKFIVKSINAMDVRLECTDMYARTASGKAAE